MADESIRKVCVSEEKVPNDCVRAIVVPLYKGKGYRNDCKNYRGISKEDDKYKER